MGASDEGRSFGLEWKVQRQQGLTTLSLKGELDLASVDVLDELAATLIADQPVLIFDLEHLGFMDSTGLRLLGRVHRNAERLGHRFLLARLSPPVRRVLHVAGLVDFFEYVEGAPPPEVLCPSCERWIPRESDRCPDCGAAF
jgi:anti-sigma B factor antagonist